ncbi:Retrovirus-related Pol polyprotein from transposon TNT 1-94 [Vitis vinifera]|uniref:Retrovirus-related Pol polyprotein from transposon TNT 1-94 n=1 Tax=Vitis vinifera TaxID=29760 RepID=A0A438DRV7_VITVI|nr:Retrovirus-related Pol polyprotein from transposon TNT 1-94 [Vitis vinifera]
MHHKTQFSARIKILRSDNGGEYVNQQFQTYFNNHGILHETSCSQTPQQNGIAERKNRHILETAHALLINAHVPNRYWSDAVTTAVYLLNRMPTKVLQFQTPLKGEIYGEERNWFDVEVLEVSDNPTHPNNDNDLVEHDPVPKPLRIEAEPVPESSEDAESDVFPHSLVPNDPPTENIPEVSSPTTPLQNNAIDTFAGYVLPFRHNRGKPPNRYSPDIEERRSKYPIANHVSTQRLSEPLRAFAHTLSSCQIPSRVEEAFSDLKWAQAIKEELEVLQKNNTWVLSVLPEGRKTVGASGFSLLNIKQMGRLIDTRRANLDWPLHQLDVKNVFLHGDLEEEIYMDIPPGYTATSEAKITCRLQRALYGLKQSPRAWFGRLSSTMRKYGFQQSNSDHTLFLKHRLGKITALIVYVDDMIITGDDVEEISRLQDQLSTEFEMKNLGGLKYFLGIEVARSRQGIFLSQRKYILDLLAEVGLLECKPADIPIVQNHKLGEYVDQVPADKQRYQRLVGKLIYLSHTRPDIAYASSPGKGLMFSKNGHLKVVGYTDVDWAGNITDRKSTAGYFTFGICELIWLKKLLAEIGVAPSSKMNLFCDNTAAIAISHNPVQHDRTKYVEVDRNFIKQNLEEKIIQLPFVKSEDQLADVLTKAVSTRNFYNSLDKLGIKDIYAPT